MSAPVLVRQERQPAMPGAHEVAPDVLRIQLPLDLPGLGHINCYVIPDRAGFALVDPGMPSTASWRVLVRTLAEIGLPVRRCHTVLVTHSHPDHYGAAARLRQVSGAELVTHENFKTYWDPHEEDDFVREVAVPGDYSAQMGAIENAMLRIARLERHSPWDRPLPWGGPPPDNEWRERVRWRIVPLLRSRTWQPPRPSARVHDGQVIRLADRDWQAVHTPGHTDDHLCLLDPTEGTFVSGDHLLPTITPHISGLTTQRQPLRDFFGSLERMFEFSDVRTVLPAHGLVFDDLVGRSKEIIQHHHERIATITHAAVQAPEHELTVAEYSKVLFKPHSWGVMADSETFAHLEYLRQIGRAEARAVDGHLRYRVLD